MGFDGTACLTTFETTIGEGAGAGAGARAEAEADAGAGGGAGACDWTAGAGIRGALRVDERSQSQTMNAAPNRTMPTDVTTTDGSARVG